MRDIDIRRELLRKVKYLHKKERDTLYMEELGLFQGSSRIDLAVVNGKLHGYEIKSEKDTLVRLESQRDAYCEALEYVTIVAAESHLESIKEIVPEWWGIWSARTSGQKTVLTPQREATKNPAQSTEALAQLLWRDEALAALEARGLAKGMKGKARKEIWSQLAIAYKTEELSNVVRSAFKLRGENWRASS